MHLGGIVEHDDRIAFPLCLDGEQACRINHTFPVKRVVGFRALFAILGEGLTRRLAREVEIGTRE